MAKRKKAPKKQKGFFYLSIFAALCILLLIFGFKSKFTSLLGVSTPNDVVVNVVDILQTGTAGGARLGINTNYWWDDQANRKTGARSLSTALTDMGTKYWRYPGGEKADGYLWSTPPFTSSNPKFARVSSQDWPSNDPLYWTPAGDVNGGWAHDVQNFDEFMTVCRAANCTPVIVVAYDGIYKPANAGGSSLTRQEAIETAVGWVNYANNVKGYNIKYWEIGNETWNPGYMGSDPGRTQQAQDLITFCQAMKNVDQTIWCGTTANSQTDWNTLLSIAASQIDFLSVHSYESYAYADYNSYMNSAFYPNKKVDEAHNALKGYVAHKDRVKIMVTETGGITYGTNGNWTQADLGHALMTFDNLAQLQQDKRVEFTQFWNTRFVNQNQGGNVWPYDQSEYDALKPDNSFSPQGMAINILSDYSLTNMVQTTSTATVRTFASHDPATGKLNVWLINKSTVEAPTIITLQNYTAGSTVPVSVLRGSGSTDTNPTFTNLTPGSVTNNQVSITLSPVSITVLQLTGSSVTPTATPAPTVAPDDTTPPNVTLTFPTDGSLVSAAKSITIQAAGSDNVRVTKIEFYMNSTRLCRDSSSPYSCNWKVPKGTGVTYYLSAVAYDAAGNNSKSTIITVTSR